MCRAADVAPDKFEISLYLAQGFKFKFFRHHGWGSHEEIEIWAEDLTINQPTLSLQVQATSVPVRCFRPECMTSLLI